MNNVGHSYDWLRQPFVVWAEGRTAFAPAARSGRACESMSIGRHLMSARHQVSKLILPLRVSAPLR